MTSSRWLPLVSSSLREAGWAPVLVFTLHVIASRAFAAYDLFPPLDIPMHFLGGAAITFFIARSYRLAERLRLLGQPAPWLYVLVVSTLATTATVFWEFAEYISDRYFGTHAQLGLDDTLLDMLLGFLGSVTFLAVSSRSSVAARRPVTQIVRAGNEDGSCSEAARR